MLDQNKHKQIMVKILNDIYQDHDLLRLLGFKGGTMAYLFYDLPRFSVDLDFDLLNNDKEDLVFNKIKIILSKYGEIKQEDNKRYSLFFMLRYELGQHNVKIDINKRTFGSQYDIKNYLGIDILCMKIEDMVANKFVAMYERLGEANRDLFDMHYFLSQYFNYNLDIIKSRTGLSIEEFINKSIESIESLSDTYILDGLGELVDDKQKYFIKNKLRKDLILLLKLRL